MRLTDLLSHQPLIWETRYRIFGELLDLAVQNGLQLSTLPSAIIASPVPAASPPLTDFTAPAKTTTNPLQILQPPAFYFYMAASCTVQRRQRFIEAQTAEVRTNPTCFEQNADDNSRRMR